MVAKFCFYNFAIYYWVLILAFYVFLNIPPYTISLLFYLECFFETSKSSSNIYYLKSTTLRDKYWDISLLLNIFRYSSVNTISLFHLNQQIVSSESSLVQIYYNEYLDWFPYSFLNMYTASEWFNLIRWNNH